MRASTIFALIIAVLLGLGVMVLARATNWFGFARPAQAAQPGPEELVLVAARNIHKGKCITAEDLAVRPARPEEVRERARLLQQDPKNAYAPAYIPYAVGRIAEQPIDAGSIIRRGMLRDLSYYNDQLNERITPGFRTVTLMVPLNEVAGGLIEVGDYVDVHLKSVIEPPAHCLSAAELCGLGFPSTRSAILARDARVVVRRNTLWPNCRPYTQCITNITLELNPYRAALVEYAKDRGLITLTPIAKNERYGDLEERRNAFLKDMGEFPGKLPGYDNKMVAGIEWPLTYQLRKDQKVVYRDNMPVGEMVAHIKRNDDYYLENYRVRDVLRGVLKVDDAELMRVFDIRYALPTPPLPEYTVARYEGVIRGEPNVFRRLADPFVGVKLDNFRIPDTAGGSFLFEFARTDIIRFWFRCPDAVCDPTTGYSTTGRVAPVFRLDATPTPDATVLPRTILSPRDR